MFVYGRHATQVILDLMGGRYPQSKLAKSYPEEIERYAGIYRQNLKSVLVTGQNQGLVSGLGKGINITTTDRKQLEKKVNSTAHQGIVFEFRQGFAPPNIYDSRAHSIDDFIELAGDDGHILVLDRIKDVQNLGAIIRSAEGLGFAGLICSRHDSAPITGACHHTSTGASLFFPIRYETNLNRSCEAMKKAGFWLIAADSESDAWSELPSDGRRWGLLIGNEESGLKNNLKKIADYNVAIPMQGHSQSLNASVSAAVMMSHIMQLNG